VCGCHSTETHAFREEFPLKPDEGMRMVRISTISIFISQSTHVCGDGSVGDLPTSPML
jgi:hypothetical protein